MSNGSLIAGPGSNDSRIPFDSHFREFEPPSRYGQLPIEFVEIRSNPLERQPREVRRA